MKNQTKIANRTYATNNDNEGLFVWNRNNWKQLVGTCDFNVNNVKDKPSKIRRYVKKNYSRREN